MMTKPTFSIRMLDNTDTMTKEISIYDDGRVLGVEGNVMVINRLPELIKIAREKGMLEGRNIERQVQEKQRSQGAVGTIKTTERDTTVDEAKVIRKAFESMHRDMQRSMRSDTDDIFRNFFARFFPR